MMILPFLAASLLIAGIAGNPTQGVSISGEIISNDDLTVTLVAIVSGGDAETDTYTWTLPDGSSIQPGVTSATFVASEPTGPAGAVRLELLLQEGYTTSPQSFTVRAVTASNWWATFTYNLQARYIGGTVQGSLTIDSNNVITIDAEVVGGDPAPTDFLWTVQHPNGTYSDYKAGEGPASAVATNSQGSPSTTLTITSLASITRSFKLYVTSESHDGQLYWWSSRTWRVSRTA